MQRYVFKDTVLGFKAADKADPSLIGARLAKITAAHDGRLTPGDVLKDARSDKSPLHQHFEWDDGVAAEAFRIDQARSLISAIRIVAEPTEKGDQVIPVRAYLSVADNGIAYRHMEEVRQSADLQAIVLRQAERDLLAFEQRYRDLLDICEIVRGARERIAGRIAKIESRDNGH